MAKINVVTGNQNKVKEIREIMKDLHLDIGTKNIDLLEIQGSPEEIAKYKAMEGIKYSESPIIVEDVSFVLKCLGNLPGPYIKYFVQQVKAEGWYKIAKGIGE